MQKKTLILKSFLFLLATFSTAFSSPTSYLDSDPGARPSGMGSAFTGLSDDGNAPIFNPAGLTNMGLNQFEASASVGILTQDRLHNFLSASQQLPPKSYLGFDVIQYGVNNIDGRDVNGLPTSNLQDIELSLATSYAYEISYQFKIGIRSSFLYQNLAEVNSRGFGGVDIGIIVIPSVLYDFTIGACIHHLGGFLTWDTGNTEYLSPDLRIGFSQKFLSQTLILAYDAEWLMQSNLTIIHHAGIEWWTQKFLAFRGGWDQNDPTAGISVRYLNYSLDYSFRFESNNLGNSQRITLNLAL